MEPRAVLHLDMDAFFASVEQRDRPELRGRPVLVGHDGPRGVVAAASYEARVFGCRSAMAMSVAKRRCPEAVIVPVRHRDYADESRRVFEILESVAPVVEPLSIDEAFLDLTGTARALGSAIGVAELLRERIRAERRLTASVGVAPNKFLAKLASDLRKPDGLVVVAADRVLELLDPLPVERLWGVGPATAAALHAAGLFRIGDVRARTRDELERRFGRLGTHLHQLSWGRDDRPVVRDGEARSIGSECTFEADVEEPDEVRRVLAQHAEEVAARLRRQHLHARTVTVKIRYGDFETITRSHALEHATDGTRELRDTARVLFDAWVERAFRPVRLIGVTASRLLHGAGQLDLFAAPGAQRDVALDRVLDGIRERFGQGAIRRGS